MARGARHHYQGDVITAHQLTADKEPSTTFGLFFKWENRPTNGNSGISQVSQHRGLCWIQVVIYHHDTLVEHHTQHILQDNFDLQLHLNDNYIFLTRHWLGRIWFRRTTQVCT